jgi:hypothetical protein
MIYRFSGRFSHMGAGRLGNKARLPAGFPDFSLVIRAHFALKGKPSTFPNASIAR